MKFNKLMHISIIILVLMMVMGAASAANNHNVVGADNGNLAVEHNGVSDTLRASDGDVLGDGNTGNSWYVKAGVTGGDGSEENPFGDLKTAIDNDGLQPGDTIYVMDGTYTGLSNTGLKLDAQNLTIINYANSNPIFDAENERQIFDITGNNIVISGLKFVNGNSPYGGVMDIEGNNVSIKNCDFNTGNGGYGGFIYIDPGYENVVVDSCDFTKGTATAMGGAIFSNNKGAVISNCKFDSNYALYGAGIVTQRSMEILNNTFLNGNSTYGGAILVFGNNANNVIIDNNKFNKNTAEMGGAIMFYSRANHNNTISNCNFYNNIAENPSSKTTGNYLGGAVYISSADNKIVNTSFTLNKANPNGDVEDEDTNYYGGAIYATSSGSNTLVDNCTFLGNYAEDQGGAIYLISTDNTIVGSKFTNNNAMSTGGAICSQRSNTLIENSTFFRNAAGRGAVYLGTPNREYSNQTINNCNFIENGIGDSKGGAIYSYSNNTSVVNSNFTNNKGMLGGAIVFQGGPNFLENDTFTGNKAVRYGGGAISSARFGDTINNCTFKDNSAQGYGGAVSADYPTITNSTFINNNANHGGAICTITANVSNSEFYDNVADDDYVILAATNLIESNNTHPGQVALSMNHTKYMNMDYDVDKEIAIMPGYYAYCMEEYADYPQYGVLWENLRFAQNSLDENPVGEYVKILIYKYWNDESQHENLQKLVNIFTDHDFRNSDNPTVQDIVALYDSGYRVQTNNALRFYENGTIAIFNFRVIITPSETQNVFAFNITYNPNLTIKKGVCKIL